MIAIIGDGSIPSCDMFRCRDQILLIFSLFLFHLSPSDVLAVVSTEVKSPGHIPLNGQIEFLEDPLGTFTFQEIERGTHEGKFFRPDRKIPNFGFSPSVYWLRFSITNSSGVNRWILALEYPQIDSVMLYERGVSDNWKMTNTGDSLPFRMRPLRHRNFLFPLNLADGETRHFIFRMQTEGSHQYPFSIISTDEFHEEDRNENFVFGVYYGILIVLSIYNLVLFLLVRDRSFLYYFLYIGGFGLIMLNLNGFAYQYLWPESSFIENRSLPFFIGWAFLWSLQFTRKYLNSVTLPFGIDRFMMVLMACMVVLMFSSLTLSYYASITVAALLVSIFSILVFLAGFISFRRGYRPARYFLVAWTMLLIGVFVYSMRAFGVLASNVFTDYGWQIGSALEMCLLSLGLGDRMQLLNDERQAAQILAIENRKLYKEAEFRTLRLEIELLKKNIEPHFILNSINAVTVWMEEEPSTAIRLLNALSDELRLLLNVSGERLIPLEQELSLCRSHLEVMGLRHDKRFELSVEGLEGDETIPPLIFHTLIENGLTHGFRDRRDGRFVIEKSRVSPSNIRYTVFNNGSGAVGGNENGFGMRYIRTRLAEVYPTGWRIDSGPVEGGWISEIEIEESGQSGIRGEGHANSDR